MQPGDNFVIAASLSAAYRDEFQAYPSNDLAILNMEGIEIPISGEINDDLVAGIRTQMLTVWRRLHIEVDSMENVTINKVMGTFPMKTSVSNGYPVLQVMVNNSLEPNRFENGRLETINGSFEVFENTANAVSIINNQGTFTIAAGQSFTLYDDDDFNSDDGTLLRPKHGDEGEDIPLLMEDFLKDSNSVPIDINTPDSNALAPAYIRPKYDLTGSGDETPFLANISANTGQAVRNAFLFNNYLLNTREDFWTVYLLSGYQYTLNSDGDPISESTSGNRKAGISDSQMGQGSIVFLEAHAPHECYTTPIDCSIYATKVHEIGHLLNADHNQGGVMDNISINFSDFSLNEIRKNLRP